MGGGVFFSIRSSEQMGIRSAGYEDELPKEIADYGIDDEQWAEFIDLTNRAMKYDWFFICLFSAGPALILFTWWLGLQNKIIHEHMKRMCRKINAEKKMFPDLILSCQWENEGEMVIFGGEEGGPTKAYHYIHFARREEPKYEEDY
ncbi:hypothetical protein TrCOL_g9658 [Triparma columacea]|uniref:Uncharacterized protein n=1 Tax=Triparma columacea TaxID=722753 RepID=A0A9W7LEF6_9STRA|nr:hypothetical protein TrCOL_g9658 [Triparma columacea]